MTTILTGALWNSLITKKKHKKMEVMTMNGSQKEHFFAVWELNRKAESLHSTSAGNMH